MATLTLTISDPASGRTATATARLHQDAAPEATRRFLAACPMRATLRHVRWSGEAGYVLVDELRDPAQALENRVSAFCRGSIGFRPEHGEVAIAYGSAQARDWWGIGWATKVADLDGDVEAFLDMVRSTQRTGAKQLTIDAEEA